MASWYKLLIFLTFTLSSYDCWSMLKPISFEKQLKASHGVIYGQFLGSNMKRLRDGSIVTEVSFNVVKSVGIEQRYMLNTKFFKFHYEGGEWNGLVHKNPFKPNFQPEAEYVVILDKTAFGFKLYDDKNSVYDVVSNMRETSLVSQAFPTHPEFGSATMDQFDLWVRIVHGSYLEAIHSDRYIHRGKGVSKRAPATIDDQVNEPTKKTNIHIIWYAVVLGVLGAFHIRSRKSS